MHYARLLCGLWVSLTLATTGITSADPCVAERIARVDITGIKAGATADAVASLAVLQGTLDDPRRTDRVVRVATAALHAAGYARASIELAREDSCGVVLTATVALGPRFRIGAITFVTDDAFPAARRLELIEDALGTVNTVGGIYVADRLESGLAELRRRYRDAGWARAEVGNVEADYDDSTGRVSLTIPIHAGPRFRIGAVSAVNAGTDSDKLFDALGLERGAYYDREQLRAGIRRARRVLDRGIRLRAVLAPGSNEVNVEAVIDRRARRTDDDLDDDDLDRYRTGIASARHRPHVVADEQPRHPRTESGDCRYADADLDAARRCSRTAPTGGRHIGTPTGGRHVGPGGEASRRQHRGAHHSRRGSGGLQVIRAVLLALRVWLLIAILAGCAPPTYLGADVPSPCRGHDVENCLGWMIERDLVSAELGLYEDDALRDYVQSVATRLSSHSLLHAPPRVLIADRDGTYATIGARIVIGRPTLELLADEDELAAVLGHEIAHLEGRHPSVALYEQPSEDEWLGIRRDAESIADERAVELLARSGYDSSAVGRALRAVLGTPEDDETEDEAIGGDDPREDLPRPSTNALRRGRGPGVYALVGEALDDAFDDHPATADRLVRVDELASTHATDARISSPRGRDAFRTAVIGMVRGRDPRLGVRVGDVWVIAALEIAVPIANTDAVRSAGRTLSLRRGRARLAGYTIGTPWARELSASLLDRTRTESALGTVTLGTVPRSGAASPLDDSPLGKLARATRTTLPQPPPGSHVAILERPHGALVVEATGGLSSIRDLPLGVRLATPDELDAARPARVTAASLAATVAARTAVATQ